MRLKNIKLFTLHTTMMQIQADFHQSIVMLLFAAVTNIIFNILQTTTFARVVSANHRTWLIASSFGSVLGSFSWLKLQEQSGWWSEAWTFKQLLITIIATSLAQAWTMRQHQRLTWLWISAISVYGCLMLQFVMVFSFADFPDLLASLLMYLSICLPWIIMSGLLFIFHQRRITQASFQQEP